MARESNLQPGYFIFFVVLVVFAAIELSISAWLTARYNSRHDFLSITERDRVRYLLFCSVWTTLLSPIFATILYLGQVAVLASVAAHFIFLFLSWVFWLSGAAAITAAFGGGLDCRIRFVYCGQLNALEAFAWIETALLTLGFISIIIIAVRASRRGEGYRGPVVS